MLRTFRIAFLLLVFSAPPAWGANVWACHAAVNSEWFNVIQEEIIGIGALMIGYMTQHDCAEDPYSEFCLMVGEAAERYEQALERIEKAQEEAVRLKNKYCEP